MVTQAERSVGISSQKRPLTKEKEDVLEPTGGKQYLSPDDNVLAGQRHSIVGDHWDSTLLQALHKQGAL